MRITIAAAALVALLALAVTGSVDVSASDVPTVVRTVPAQGATGVDPALEAVEVWFSEDMEPGSMSLVRAEGVEKLGYREDARPYFEGPRHLVIPVRLQPDTEYGVGVNGPGKEGFRSAAGVPAAPTILRFTTAGGGAPGGQDRAQTVDPTGRWRLARVGGEPLGTGVELQLELHVFAGGEWGCFTHQDETRTFVGGAWEAEGGRDGPGPRLLLKTQGEDTPVIEILPDEVIRAHMMIDLGDERKIHPQYFWIAGEAMPLVVDGTSLRLGPEEDRALDFEPLPLLPKGALAGTWTSFGGAPVERTWKLMADGTVQGTVGQTSFRGRWNRGPSDLEVVGEGVEPVRGPWLFTPADGKEVLVDKLILFSGASRELLAFKRGMDRTPTRGPTGIVGRWSVQTEDGLARLEFKSDGTYVREFGAPGARVTVKGTWRVVGATLQVHDEEDHEDLSVPFVLVDANTLRLTIDGTPVPFTREGATTQPARPTSPHQPRPQPPQATGPADLPAALCGKWGAEDPRTRELFLLLLMANGQAEIFTRNQQGENHATGTWRHAPGKLILHNTKDGTTLEAAYQLVNATTMVLDLRGTRLQVTKIAGDPSAGG